MNKIRFGLAFWCFIMSLRLNAGTNLLHQVLDDLNGHCSTSQYCSIGQIDSWGFSTHIYGASAFTNAVAMVSNHWAEALADWNYFNTNTESRILFENIVSFAGTNALIGIWSALLDACENEPNFGMRQFIEYVHAPANGPLKNYVFLNYDMPAISNCLLRSKELYGSTNTEMRAYYDSVLTGRHKRIIEDERAMELGNFENLEE